MLSIASYVLSRVLLYLHLAVRILFYMSFDHLVSLHRSQLVFYSLLSLVFTVSLLLTVGIFGANLLLFLLFKSSQLVFYLLLSLQ